MVLWLGFGSKIINFSCDSETYRLPSHAGDLSAVLTSGSEVFGKSERFEAPKVDISSINLGVFAVDLALVSPLSSWFTSIWLVSVYPGITSAALGFKKETQAVVDESIFIRKTIEKPQCSERYLHISVISMTFS